MPNKSISSSVFRPTRSDELDGEVLFVLLLPVAVGLVLAWMFLGLPTPKCGFYELTGIPCGGCGTTRAFGALDHGDLRGAFRWNPLATFGMLASGVIWIYSVAVWVFRLPRFRPLLSHRSQNGLRIAIVLLFVANWIYLIRFLP